MGKNKVNDDGRTLFQAVGEGPVEARKVFRLTEPVISAAARIHQDGRYYGNIGPGSVVIYDRVWLCHRLPAQKPGSGEGQKGTREAAAIPPAVLLYRDRPRDGSETFCVPVEEYLGGEMTGPWSDVYSICAVMYSLLTGRRPADAKARMRGELLEPPSRLGVSIGANRERVIMKGLEILQKDRWQNGRELYQALFEEVNDRVSDAVPAEKPEKAKKNRNVLTRQKGTGRMLGTAIWCSEILTVSFLDTLAEKPQRYWDVSDRKDGSVLAWVQEREGGYDFYIAGEGGVVGNPDSSGLFKDCYRMRSVNFGGCFDTSQVTNMCGMFDCCSCLEELDVSSFDTAAVTNMISMFSGCVSLTSLDLSSFDTAAVTTMTNMFSGCLRLSRLDAEGFSMKQVKYTSGMFAGCNNLTGAAVKGISLDKIKKGY